MIRILSIFALVAAFAGCASSPTPSLEPNPDFSPEQAARAHPVQMYHHAGRLLEAGDMNEAAFWFYAGQLRYRVHLMARPGLPPDRDPALFASLNSVLGQEINEYLGAHPDEWERVIERVLNWDANTPNDFTPKSEYSAEHEEVRSGLTELWEMVRNNREELQKAAADREASNR